MTAAIRRRRSTLVAGSAITPAACAAITSGRRAAVVVDERIAHLAQDLESIDTVIAVETAELDATAVAHLSERVRAARAGVVVAIGGGTTIDAVNVAAIGVSAPRTLDWALARADGAPVVRIPEGDATGIDVVAVPTTVGTSAESNAVAIVRTAGGQCLLLGEVLRPRYAVLDDVNYRSLDARDVRAGCLEALLRLAGASTAARAHPRATAHAVTLARALVVLGHGPLSDAARLRIARCSAATQRSAALRGRAPFSPRHWYLANEVSFVARTTKMRATASVVSRVWQRIEDGDSRWGSLGPLEAFWREVVRDTRLPLAPAAGIDALVARWGLPLAPRPSEDALASIAGRVERRWARRGPALRGITAPDVRDVLDRARWDPNPSAEASRLLPPLAPESRGRR